MSDDSELSKARRPLKHGAAKPLAKGAKSSAFYQRQFRQRLREQGLVKKEVWIRPENGKLLGKIERQLREVASPKDGYERREAAPERLSTEGNETGGQAMTVVTALWTCASICEALQQESLFDSGQASIELIEGVEPAVHIVMHEFGDLPLFLTVSGEQIIVEAVLWAMEDVRDVDQFNEAVLRTHKFFPLSTISLEAVGRGRDCYYMFGSLSARSLLANVVLEIEMLALNVIEATEAYGEFLDVAIEA